MIKHNGDTMTKDPTIPVYPEVRISYTGLIPDSDVFLTSESYIPVYNLDGKEFLNLCEATANMEEMDIRKAIEIITKEMNTMALNLMNKVVPDDKLKNCVRL